MSPKPLVFATVVSVLSLVGSAQTNAAAGEAVERRQRSLAQLEAEQVPFRADGPLFEQANQARLRSPEEIAKRAVGVGIAALKADRSEQKLIDSLVKQFKAKKLFTPQEADFVDNNAPTNTERDIFLWRYESLWVLMWALGYVEELGRPDQMCNVSEALAPLRGTTLEQLVKNAKPRSAAEILDAADLTYRYHEAVADARSRREKPPAKLERGVVYQRHYAFNWLLSHRNQSWDEVSIEARR